MRPDNPLLGYFAIQSWKRKKDSDVERWISDCESFFEPYLGRPGLVLIPRFNEKYISFRYCGLEVLRLKPKKVGNYEWRSNLVFGKDDKIYSASTGKKKLGINGYFQDKPVAALNELTITKRIIQRANHFFVSMLDTAMMQERLPKNNKKTLPGFIPEHWLENLFVSDTHCGKKTREVIGLSGDDYNVKENIATQIPVTLKPIERNYHIRRKCNYIDFIAVHSDKKRLVLVELKKDDQFSVAKDEIERYYSWAVQEKSKVFKKRSAKYSYILDIKKGSPTQLMERGYMPEWDGNRELIRKVVVIVSGTDMNINTNDVELYYLPEHWLKNAAERKSLFAG